MNDSRRAPVAAAIVCLALGSACLASRGAAAAEQDLSRGRLLYETHCIGCHDKQVHWRERRLAHDWPTLAAQVRRWQTNTGLGWSQDEIDDVAGYLNTTIYRFQIPGSKQIGMLRTSSSRRPKQNLPRLARNKNLLGKHDIRLVQSAARSGTRGDDGDRKGMNRRPRTSVKFGRYSNHRIMHNFSKRSWPS
jgi:hypothetical protein